MRSVLDMSGDCLLKEGQGDRARQLKYWMSPVAVGRPKGEDCLCEEEAMGQVLRVINSLSTLAKFGSIGDLNHKNVMAIFLF